MFVFSVSEKHRGFAFIEFELAEVSPGVHYQEVRLYLGLCSGNDSGSGTGLTAGQEACGNHSSAGRRDSHILTCNTFGLVLWSEME